MFVRDVAEALEARGVRYAVVGGVAVNLHGIPRLTYDLDIVVERDAFQLAQCRAALEALGLRCRLPLALESLASETVEALRVTFTDPLDPLREVDVLVDTPIAVNELIERSRRLESKVVSLQVVSLADLVALKRAAARPQDLADLAHLERLLPRPRT